MKKLYLKVLIFIIVSSFSYNSYSQEIIKINDEIDLIKISDNFYIHNTLSENSQYGRFSSNGLLVMKNGRALMIDTPTSNETTKTICDFLKDSLDVEVTTFIGGHFHIDCIGGMDYLKKIGIKTILNQRTKDKCIENNLPLPDITFDTIYKGEIEGIKFECRYFGGGHSADNIVVYFPESQILFGGCLIKSLDTQSIGNLSDAVVGEWINTIEKISSTFSQIKYVVPGHGNFGNESLLTHTIAIVNKYLDQNKKED